MNAAGRVLAGINSLGVRVRIDALGLKSPEPLGQRLSDAARGIAEGNGLAVHRHDRDSAAKGLPWLHVDVRVRHEDDSALVSAAVSVRREVLLPGPCGSCERVPVAILVEHAAFALPGNDADDARIAEKAEETVLAALSRIRAARKARFGVS